MVTAVPYSYNGPAPGAVRPDSMFRAPRIHLRGGNTNGQMGTVGGPAGTASAVYYGRTNSPQASQRENMFFQPNPQAENDPYVYPEEDGANKDQATTPGNQTQNFKSIPNRTGTAAAQATAAMNSDSPALNGGMMLAKSVVDASRDRSQNDPGFKTEGQGGGVQDRVQDYVLGLFGQQPKTLSQAMAPVTKDPNAVAAENTDQPWLQRPDVANIGASTGAAGPIDAGIAAPKGMIGPAVDPNAVASALKLAGKFGGIGGGGGGGMFSI